MRTSPLLLLLLLTACGDNLTVVERDDYEAADIEPLSCVPNLDGRIDNTEIAAAIGVPVRFLVSPAGTERDIDVVGDDEGEGRLWDMAVDYADDQQVTIVPAKVTDRWYQGSFPPDAFVTLFDPGGSIESVGRLDDEALWVLGLASTEENPPEGKTLIVYQQPVAVLRFPIEPGVSFVSKGDVSNGMIRGLPYAGMDTYEVEVDAVGQLDLPQLTFTQVHRVRQHVTVRPAVGAVTTQRRVSWFSECFAEVARIISLPGESEPDFSTAAEVWRLGLQ
ncbi:hypothetical protein JYT22_01220 [Endomicrobium sp. AH-315-J14]|nr:hypothetical protein [Endomicrobium sp. AH-315-J14]